ncbi:MAG: TetR/AcrR family transcriptional regulator [Acidimicrobiales bacterium]|nr:TetR/AcrR family transcriptional regulator [Acidimicrobiales bacterium]
MTEAEQAAPRRMPSSKRGRRTRANLIDSGRIAIVEDGVESLRVDDVVSRAGASHGTFYLYFANVGELVAAVVDACDEEFLRLFSPVSINVSMLPSAIDALVAGSADLHRRYGAVASLWFDHASATDRLARVHAIVCPPRPYVDSEGPPPTVEPDASARALAVLALLDRLAADRSAEAVGREPAELAEQVAVLLSSLFGDPQPKASD